jgi:hypothetical protein
MNSTETDLVRRIMLRLGIITGVRLFRNNTGTAWQGNGSYVVPNAMRIDVQKGDVVIRQGRIIHFGLCKGSSDLIGFKSVAITPEMVGKPIAVFMAAEIKTPSGKATEEQIAFIETVNRFGGLGFIARTEDEAEELFNKKP